ncbi:putative ferric-chelate reductase 1 isoform X2 [Xiphias gladius]|uniref:putative ferric-chelate reductase 1 isoform X2 n=1 Tax=Xiphias gladius TaxID=8245 RepID=UPI001A985824|nr:putative ferric-chelate reductase 1 isoform X2 [Xiphias gladius]
MDHIVLLLVCVAPVIWCYSSGQVMDSCENMQPHHSYLSPQIEPAPFTITTDNSNDRLGEEVKVQLQALGSTPFIGFLLQAREVGGLSPVGTFTLTAGAAQLLICSQRPNSAVSHRSQSVKTSIQVTWRSEVSRDRKPIQFHASFVQNYWTFWVDVTSLALTFTNDSSGGSTSPPPKPTITSSSTTPTTNTKLQPTPGGNDDIYICGIGSNGLVWLQHACSTGRTAPQAVPLGNVSDVRVSSQDRVISCSFTSMNTISTQRTTGFDKTYHLMFAHGPSSNGQIQFHASTFISTDKIDISRPWIVRKAGWPHIIKAHGALMLIAWMTMGSLGMMTARYLKGVAKGQNLWGKDVWFLVHVAVMSVTTTATVIAFVLSFSYVKAWSKGAHPVLGCLVMILLFFQPLLALLRCGAQHPLRFLFNWSHASNGVVIKALAVAAILTGLKLIDSTLMKVMGGFVGWEALFYILLDVHSKWKVNSTDTLESKMITIYVLLMALFFVGNFTFLVALLVGIWMS